MRYLLLLTLILSSCASKSAYQKDPELMSIQVVDRNGFSETISSKDRLATLKNADFETPQPYKKVLRVYGKNSEGKTKSLITSYHENGHVWQSLEVFDGRAQGNYREWHPNGQTKLQAHIIEGIADLHEGALSSFIFEGENKVWDEEGRPLASISYEKGMLHGPSSYYHTSGTLFKKLPFYQNELQGTVSIYNEDGVIVEECSFDKGVQTGQAFGFWETDKPSFVETYSTNGRLDSASYYNKEGSIISEIKDGNGFQAYFEDGYLQTLAEYKAGFPCGIVKTFAKEGKLLSSHYVKEGKKDGEELFYYDENLPKISLQWHEDTLQGQIKTWYENGILQSQRELNGNKKEGLSFAWYKDGSLMLMEEYENDLLVKGSYYKKKDKKPLSTITQGKGVAILFDENGSLMKKISYEKGKPILNAER